MNDWISSSSSFCLDCANQDAVVRGQRSRTARPGWANNGASSSRDVDPPQAQRLLYTGKRHLHLSSWSPDGQWIAFTEFGSRSSEAWAINVQDPSKLLPIGTTPANEDRVVFSHDGHWIAYDSDETGRPEVYVTSFPDLKARQQISVDGGSGPRWSHSDSELWFYGAVFPQQATVMRSRRSTTSRGTTWQQPVSQFKLPWVVDGLMSPNGRQGYFALANPGNAAPELYVVVNWLRDTLAQADGPAR